MYDRRYFVKHGHPDQDPTKIKKDGAGCRNWGYPGDELSDEPEEFHMMKERRRSNSTANRLTNFKTKFEQVEDEPVFDESLHGPINADGQELKKQSTNESSEENHSPAEEDAAGKRQ